MACTEPATDGTAGIDANLAQPAIVEGKLSMHQNLIVEFALQNRIAVITGAASGIGRETARVFAQAGAAVVLADIDGDGLSVTAAIVEAVGGAAITHVTDVSRRADVESLADLAFHQLGQLDVWINAAGILRSFAILDANEAEIDRLFAANLKGQYWGCAAAGRVMQASGGGSIVNISSAAADNPREMLSAYAISKAGVNMLTRSAAIEFGSFHCRVNAIAPGFIETPMVEPAYKDSAGKIDPLLREAFLQASADAVPLGITGRPRDVALAALYLASDASRFVTGQVLRLNGGLVMA